MSINSKSCKLCIYDDLSIYQQPCYDCDNYCNFVPTRTTEEPNPQPNLLSKNEYIALELTKALTMQHKNMVYTNNEVFYCYKCLLEQLNKEETNSENN